MIEASTVTDSILKIEASTLTDSIQMVDACTETELVKPMELVAPPPRPTKEESTQTGPRSRITERRLEKNNGGPIGTNNGIKTP